MRALLSRILLLLLLALAGVLPRAQAFSLLGAYDTWMTAELGYQLGLSDLGITTIPPDVGGPMNLGEEYRWNMPLITYGFDESFLNYFGTKGVEEIEKAIKVFNDLPAASQMSADLSEFPLDTRRLNHRASALYLYDLRSYTMAALLEALGAAPAERYVWTLRSRTVINNVPYYTVIKRNFDPITSQPSSYVNSVLYTYQILQTITTPTYEAVEFEVDPSLPSVSSVSAFMGLTGGIFASGWAVDASPGLFFTGLTRDDVAALRYLYRPSNYNVETLATNVVLAAQGTASGTYLIGGSGGSSSSNPWGAPPGLTNVVGTNLAAINIALRSGVDKINFARVDYDSLLGGWVALTNVYEDKYITNYTQRSQTVQRTLAAPDVLFTAADLGIGVSTPVMFRRTISLVNLDAQNGTETLAGPGLIQPPVTITFSKLGQFLINAPEGGEGDGVPGYFWGSYDGTTAEPVIYPLGASIQDLERLVLSGSMSDSTQNPWISPFITTTTTGTTTDTTGTTGGTTGTTP